MLRIWSKLFGKRSATEIDQVIGPEVREELQRKIGYLFHQDHYLTKALTHRSYLRVNDPRQDRAYERLEFLGDSVLGLIVGEELFQKYPDMAEGDLTKSKSLLVNKKVLAHAGSKIDLGKYVYMSIDEGRAGGRNRPSIIADCLEALIGAVYLDGGLDEARNMVQRVISYDFSQISQMLQLRNFKGELLELLQSKGAGMPHYSVSNEDGPEHRKVFTVEVFVNGKKMGVGHGDSKKSAEQRAAEIALQQLTTVD